MQPGEDSYSTESEDGYSDTSSAAVGPVKPSSVFDELRAQEVNSLKSIIEAAWVQVALAHDPEPGVEHMPDADGIQKYEAYVRSLEAKLIYLEDHDNPYPPPPDKW